jgi:hypothetical protein
MSFPFLPLRAFCKLIAAKERIAVAAKKRLIRFTTHAGRFPIWNVAAIQALPSRQSPTAGEQR